MSKSSQRRMSMLGRTLRRLAVVSGAALLTLTFFLVLPIMQAIGGEGRQLVELKEVSSAVIDPPPPPPPEDLEEPEPEPEEPPPPAEQVQPLDLAQLELALNPGLAGGLLAGDFAVDLAAVAGGAESTDALFGVGELDQEPRVIYQAQPRADAKVRARAPGSVTIIFVVDERGRVAQAAVQSSDDPIFERPALAAIKQWRFEPARRKGEPVSFRLRQKITFPKQ